MNSTIRRASLGLWLGASACLILIQTLEAQTGPVLEARMYAGITLTGAVNTAYAIQATTNLADTNGWTTLANVVLTNSPWLFFDTNSPVMAKRFYRAVGMSTNTPPDTNAPAGMVLIPAGSFTMGDTFNEGYGPELPTHTVYVSAFYMEKTEVTKALWDEVYQWATNHGYYFEYAGWGSAANHPVRTVSEYDVVKWCNARSEKEGRVPAYYRSAAQTAVYRIGQVGVQNDWVKWNAGYRLPTEAEWEKAARGGLSGKRFPWGDTISHSQANYYSDSSVVYDVSPTYGYHPTWGNGTSPVGSFAPNGYGLYDMAGNVSELCWDWNGYYSSGSQTDPRGPASGVYRVSRGGCWNNLGGGCQSAYRSGGDWPVGWFDLIINLGFRSVLAPGQ